MRAPQTSRARSTTPRRPTPARAPAQSPTIATPQVEAKGEQAERTNRRKDWIILSSGLGTTVAGMLLYALLGAPPVIGVYFFVFLPAGALFLGTALCSGYGIAGFFLKGLRFRAWMLVSIFASMFLAYWGIMVVDYLVHVQADISFFAYFDSMTREARWVTEDGATSGPIGWAGYNFRFLELVAMMAGGWLGVLVVPLVTSRPRS